MSTGLASRFAIPTFVGSAHRLVATFLVCGLVSCSRSPETISLLDEQLGFPVLDGLELCPPETTVMEENRERAVCATTQGSGTDAGPRFIAAYADLATSSGWSPERMDRNRAYFVRDRNGCTEQLRIFLANGPDGEQSIVFDLDQRPRQVTTALGAAENSPPQVAQEGCER